VFLDLHVDTRWCSKCKICRAASDGRITFGEDGYPVPGGVADGDLEKIKAAVDYCPAGALALVEN
jgi:ferredoxin